MKKIILLLSFALIFGCKKEPIYNNFDEIIHYNITNKNAYKVDTIKKFHDILGDTGGSHKMDFNKFEEELLSFGYEKKEIKGNKIKQVDLFVSNNSLYNVGLTACIPYYRDILILKKKKKTVAVLKICFDCGMVSHYGKIESNLKETELDLDKYFIDFEKFHKTLTNKNFKHQGYFSPTDSLNIIQQKLKSATKISE